jgi:hypothetical protein
MMYYGLICAKKPPIEYYLHVRRTIALYNEYNIQQRMKCV